MNVLIIGLGSIAKKHIAALRSISLDFQIFALRSSIDADQFGDVVNIFDIDDESLIIDFAIISNPTHLHYQFIKLLSNKEIPIFIEKPAVHNLHKVDELLDLVSEKHLTTYVACNLRFHPCLMFLKDKLNFERKIINELNVYCGSYLPDWRSEKDFKKIYSANAAMGGGVHLDLFHELDYVTWLFGFPHSSHSITRSVSSLGIDAVDYANYILQYETFTASIVLNYYRRKPRREIDIVFEDTTWTVNLINNTIKDDSGLLLFESKDFSVLETYKSQLVYFIDCLKNNLKPMNSIQESVPVLQICLKDEK
jgi:predicted dehydrogenase